MVDADTLRALRDKYRDIKRLRDEDAAGLNVDPKAQLAELARRFPGALRELDELPMEDIAQRLAVLETVVAERGPAPQWAALRIKRLAAGRRAAHVGAVRRELESAYRPEPDEPPLASFDHAVLLAILEPNAGRLNPWVFARVALEHGVDPETVQRALFLR